jgi:hypothetical protein
MKFYWLYSGDDAVCASKKSDRSPGDQLDNRRFGCSPVLPARTIGIEPLQRR